MQWVNQASQRSPSTFTFHLSLSLAVISYFSSPPLSCPLLSFLSLFLYLLLSIVYSFPRVLIQLCLCLPMKYSSLAIKEMGKE